MAKTAQQQPPIATTLQSSTTLNDALYDAAFEILREQDRRKKLATAQAVRTVATYVAPFCLLASLALTCVGWGPPLEHKALFLIGVIAALTATLYGRLSEETASVVVSSGLSLWCLFEAATSDVIGDTLAFVGMVGLTSFLAIGISAEKFFGQKASPVVGVGYIFWFASWALFWFNAPETFRPVWCLSALQAAATGVETAVEFVFGLFLMAVFVVVAAARLLGMTPSALMPNRFGTQTTNRANSAWGSSSAPGNNDLRHRW